jgi:hypothetical protein
MKNNTFIALLVVFLSFNVVQATTRYIHTEDKGVSIPSNDSEYASEEDMVEMICYKAKWKGGEGVAHIEALEASTSPFIEKLKEIDINIEEFNLSTKASTIRSKLEAVCSASSSDEASQRVNEYISYAEEVRDGLQNDFSADLMSVRGELENRGEEVKKEIEEKLREEGEVRAKEAEEELRKQGKEEGEALETQLRALGKEFESFMSQGEVGPGAAKAKARELSGRISADSETKAFLENKFEEILKEAEGLIGQAMSGAVSPAEIRNRVQQRVPAKVEEIKEFIENKYRRMGREKENEIRAELEKIAEEMGGEERKQLEEIRDIALNLEDDINSNFQERKREWEEYEEKYLQKKAEIVRRTVEKHFEEVESLIKEKKEQIDLAIGEGVAEDFGILSYEQLLENLEKDKEEIIGKLTHSDLNESTISEVQREFTGKWNEYRKKMEVLEAESPSKVIDVIVERYDIDAHIEEVKREMEKKEKMKNGRLAKLLEACDNEKKQAATRPVGGRWDDDFRMNEINICIWCNSKDYYMGLYEDFEKLNEEAENYLKKLEEFSQKIENYKKTPPATIKEALEFRDELMTSGDKIREMEENLNKRWSSRHPENPYLESTEYCRSITR